MAVISSLIWAVVTVVTIFVVFKWYLPYYTNAPKHEEEKLPDFQITKKFIIFTYIVSVALAVLCGFFSGTRMDDWLGVCKMLFALSVLNITAITDVMFYRIPNLFVLLLLGGRILSIIPELIQNDGTLLIGLLNSVIAGISSLLFLLIVSKITQGGIGYGDVKLFGALGFLCGVRAVLYTLLFSFFLCSIVSIILLISKKKGLKDGVPMGPFTWLGFAVTIVLGFC